MKKGSITIFLALTLSLMAGLISASIESCRMAAARTQILSSVDIGLYSLFGKYDRILLEELDLFALDASDKEGNLNLAAVYDSFEHYMTPVLSQNSQNLSKEQGGISGYCVLTDNAGELFHRQVVQYMRDTLGTQGLQLLLRKMQEREEKIRQAEEFGKKAEDRKTLDSYDSEMNRAEQESQEAEEEKRKENQTEPKQEIILQKVENPIPVIKRIRKMGVLGLVLPVDKEVSDKELSEDMPVVSKRSLHQGMPMRGIPEKDDSYTSGLLFQQYLIQSLGNYTNPGTGGLSYETEYVLAGKESDVENLKSIAARLLLIREGVNFASLLADSGKRAQVRTLSVAIASGFLIPPAAVIIEGALLFCWSFAESILDVRELFDGGKVSLVKRPEEWQITLANLSKLLEGLDSMRRGSENGLSYEDYLQVLMLTRSRSEKILRTMDMVEKKVQKLKNKPSFRLDSCIVAMEVSVDVRANRKKTFRVTRQYLYD